MTPHQLKQQEVISEMDRQARHNALNFSSVAPVEDYEQDDRIGFTSLHIPNPAFVKAIQKQVLEPLKKIEPDYLYYSDNMFHFTIKGVRVINKPPHFNEEDISVAKDVFSHVVPLHNKFNVYFYKLIVFPANLSLIGTTDPEFDDLFLDLDRDLKLAGVPDDKHYLNSKYFFCTLSLCRFNSDPSREFMDKVREIEKGLKFNPYTVDSVTLVTCNAVFKKRTIIGEWQLADSNDNT